MTTTPTPWLPAFTANFAAAAGTQTVPQPIGLKNGNILVVWEDNTNGSSPSTDVMGQLFDPHGTPIGLAFQVNTDVVASDETGPQIVALPDGGYVIAYGSWNASIGGFIGIERHAANGALLFSDIITDPNSSLTAWQLAADPAGNYTIAYERQPVLGNVDVFAVTFQGSNNARGAERRAAQNSGDDDYLHGLAAFANGHVVVFNEDPDDDFPTTYETSEFSIVDPASATLARGPTQIAGADGFFTNIFADPYDVAVLTGGQFVMLYSEAEGSAGRLTFRIGASEGGTIGAPINVEVTTVFGRPQEADVLALMDGGFFVAFHKEDSHTIWGQRYSGAGSPIGITFPIVNDVRTFNVDGTQDSGFKNGHLSLTSDGRILVTYREILGEIKAIVLDPRDNIIRGTSGDDVMTTRLESTQIFGEDGSDRLLGQDGGDELDGGAGADTLEGGDGNDFYVLRDLATRPISSSPPAFVIAFDAVVEHLNGGIDTVIVQRVSSIGNIGSSYTLPANVENGIIAGFNPTTDTFGLFGNELANELTGNAAANTLSGAGGNDRLIGNAGNDTIEGGEGFDTAVFSGLRSAYQLTQNGSVLTVIGPDGTDTLTSVERLRFDDLTLTPNPPSITSNGAGSSATVTVQENTTAVTTVIATDPDPETTLTYSISGGADAARFQINSATGALSFVSTPNFEQPGDADQNNTYVVQVRAFDGGLFDDQTLTIGVSNANEAPVISSNGGGNGAGVSIAENTTAITTVTAADPDAGTTLTYSISGGADASRFQINSATGALFFMSAPNFEQPADADHNNSYLVTVRASDGSLFDDQAIAVNVSNISEPPRWLASVDIGPHPVGWVPVSTGDYNNDATSDVLWFNAANLNVDLWKIANGQWAGSQDIGSHPASWQPSATGDFDGDGTNDVLWYNPSTGNVDIWKIANGQWAGSVDVGPHPLGWQPAGSGDFNNDGTSDVLWYNPATGNVDIWKLSNAQWAGSQDIGPHPLGWQPVGTGDFDGDGTSDVLWFNPATGNVDLWKISNGQWAGSVDIGAHPLGWVPAGIGDFNADGTSDVAWFNAANGNFEVWLISDGHWAASVDIGAHPLGWEPAGIGDFDNNGVSDVLWHETSTNRVETWLLAAS